MGERVPAPATPPSGLTRLRDTARTWGMGERSLKTALAASLAWEAGTLVPGGTAHPYFAPLAALLSLQITVAESIVGAAQRVVGIVAGVGVALVVSRVTGANAWGIGLLVLLSLAVGARLRLGPQAVTQVAVSALLVMFVGNASSLQYAGSRILESVVGALIGVAVNALLIPPSTLPQARKAQQALGVAVAAVLSDLANAVGAGLTREEAARCLAGARALTAPRAAATAELERAETSLRYNMLRRGQLAALARLKADHEALEHAAMQTRSLARALADALAEGTADDPRVPDSALAEGATDAPRVPVSVMGESATDAPLVPAGAPARGGNPRARAWPALAMLAHPLAALIAALAVAVGRFVEDGASSSTVATALAGVARRRHDVDIAMHGDLPTLPPDAWMRVGALLASADRMRADLTRSAQPSRPEDDRLDALETSGSGD